MIQGMSRKVEFYATLFALIGSCVTAGFVMMSYAHATFMTRSEANDRKEAVDKNEQRFYDSLLRIENKLDAALIEKAKK